MPPRFPALAVDELAARLGGPARARRTLRWLYDAPALPERLPVHVGHDIEEATTRLSRIQQRQDVRMLEPGRRPDLLKKAFPAQCGGDVIPDDLDRDPPLMPDVMRQIDARHPSGAERPLEPVSIVQGGR